MKKRVAMFACAAVMFSLGTVTAFAAETTDGESAASYSYLAGQQRGASYRSDGSTDNENSDMSSYNYVAGQQRGSSYHQ